MKQRIVLLGPPASGKGTQAELMQARYQLPIASPGTILREERKLGTALGIEAEKSTNRGQLAPDSLVNAVVESWLGRHDTAFAFDGYPRSLGQAAALDQMLATRQVPLQAVLSLEADLATIRSRVARRLMCSACGGIVSIGWQVASADAACPSCGGALIRRNDDAPATLDLRMQEYADKTEPLVDYYAKRGLLHRVDANATPDVVFASIVNILEAP